MGSKYGKLLTIILVVVIAVIIGILGFFAFKIFNAGNTTKKAADKVAEFNANTDTQQQNNNNNNNNQNNSQNNSNNEGNNTSLEELLNNNQDENNISESSMYNQQNDTTNKKDTYYEGYKVIGTVSIPSIDVEYPILEEYDGLRVSIVAVHPSDPENAVNKPGNLVLWGHNYKDGTFFSNITKLNTGAKIYIKDTSGNKVTYQVYNSYQTTDSDMSYARRDVGGARELTLSTCATDTAKRDIIWAREVE